MTKSNNSDLEKKHEAPHSQPGTAEKEIPADPEYRNEGKHDHFDRLDLIILFFIVLFTIFLRTYALSYPDKVYFDELHYVPAARAYMQGAIDPNYIHPPMAKEVMAGFMEVFGDNPIGWRMGSVITGTIMVIIMYLMGITMFRSRFIAIMAALLLSTEFLHIVQSRIATLDIYIGIFVILGYYFTWLSYLSFARRYRPIERKLKSPALYLILSAVFFGGATAVKISGIAAPIGAYLFMAIALTLDKSNAPAPDMEAGKGVIEAGKGVPVKRRRVSIRFPLREMVVTAGIFAIVMGATFVATHIPLFVEKIKLGQKISVQEDLLYTRTFKFHYNEKFTHPYLSQMWQWPTVHRPIWYYWNKDDISQKINGIFAVGNLLFWWSFLAVLIDMVYRAFTDKNRKIIFILCGYLTLYLFWLSSASNYGGYWHLKGGFFYYMLPAVPFMVLAVAETLNDLRDSRIGRVSVVIYLIGLFVFLAAFYPILTGVTVDSALFDHIMKIGVFKSWI